MDEENPLCLGGHGLSPKADNIILPLINKADCILLVGYDPIECGLVGVIFGTMQLKLSKSPPPCVPTGMHRVDTIFNGAIEPTLNQLSSALKMNTPWKTVNRGVPALAFSRPLKLQRNGVLDRCFPPSTMLAKEHRNHR